MGKIIKLKEKELTPYDGFNTVAQLDKIERENLEAKNQGLPEPHTPPFIPLEWRDGQHWYYVTEISKCLTQTSYVQLGKKGIPPTLREKRIKEKGARDHYRLGYEFHHFSSARNVRLLDRVSHIYGFCDEEDINYITGEPFITDFKTIDQWLFKTRVKREGLSSHLRKTEFYVPIPDDELQVMLYVYLFRQFLRYPMRFGQIIYENRNNPNERKSCLVEYDEMLIKKFLEHFEEMKHCVARGQALPPYIASEAYVHHICRFRLICPRGQEAELIALKKKKNIPWWKILELKRRAKQEMPKLPPPQGSLFSFK